MNLELRSCFAHLRAMQTNENDPAERLCRQQDVLAKFGSHAFATRDLDEILNRASQLVAEGLDVKRAKVLELLPGGKELLIRAGVNWNPGVVGHVRFGADTNSPAGFALNQQEPVTSPDLDKETRFKIPAVLIEHGIKSMVNVIIEGDDAPFGVLEVDASNKRDFDEHDTAFLKNYANLLAAVVERHRSHENLTDALSGQAVLIQELEHRVKNMLALVQSLAKQTSAKDASAAAFRDSFLGRLRALTQAEMLVFDDHAQVVELQELVNRSVEPFAAANASRLTKSGPALRLPARGARILALVLHELGTNATKYGALSVPDGRVRLSWEVEETKDGRQVHFRWYEEGGPEVTPPVRKGFGTKLLSHLAGYELDGQAHLEHLPEGFRYKITFPVEGV